ncbi:MAG: hypothetical protein MUC36_29640 [Planctomycetes bacterium]|nr:hypothetical protein [Planctomycetota bacterium]
MLALPDGDVLAGGWFTTAGGVPAKGLARWRGGAWHAVHDVVGNVYSLAMGSNGEIGVGGAFWSPATGSSNLTFRIRTTGYASSSIAAALIGSQATNQLLSSAHSAGLPGCSLLTSPDWVLFALPVAGVVELELPIQNTPALRARQ